MTRSSWLRRGMLGLAALVILGCAWLLEFDPLGWNGAASGLKHSGLNLLPVAQAAELAPEAAQDPKAKLPDNVFEGALGWINTGGPIRLSDLRGKIVLLDFWTYCCINCHHVLPDLEFLEEKYPNQLVVIGVHTAKFEAERVTENIRQKVREYRIKHPVANDGDQIIWNRLGVNSWPTLVLIDANGFFRGYASGEGNRDVLDREIGKLIAQHKAKGELSETPVKFQPESDKPSTTALLYPGKVLADPKGKRLFISDTGHNRIIITDLDGKLEKIIGSGEVGRTEGGYDKATFNRQQGMCLFEGNLYVADTENHAIRVVDLKAETVKTLAGNGSQSNRRRGRGPAATTALNSPWDLLPLPGQRTLAVAMAGPHQIWTLNLDDESIGVWAGSGYEASENPSVVPIQDGSLSEAAFAQPSGLASDGENLFVADSEVSGVRAISLGKSPMVRTLIGKGLFVFEDAEGPLARTRLQHCLGLAYNDGVLYIADTYNNKIKAVDLKNSVSTTLVGDRSPGEGDEPPRFYQPGGLSIANGVLYVADTNNHQIRAVDLATRKVRTLTLENLGPPTPRLRAPRFLNPQGISAPAAKVAPGKAITLDVAINLPENFKFSPTEPIPFVVQSPSQADAIDKTLASTGGMIDSPTKRYKREVPSMTFKIEVPLTKEFADGETLELRVSVMTFICKNGSEGFCTVKSLIWNVPVTFAKGADAAIHLTNPVR